MSNPLRALVLRFDLRSGPGGAAHGELYAAALDLCAWADGLDGVDRVSVVLSEHHGSPDGYLPSPIVLAAAMAGRTRRLRIDIAAALLPLYHPVRLAEDLAVLDLASGGRVDVVLAAGYRTEEFDAFGVDIAQRGRLVEDGIAVLEQAWTGEPFERDGARVQVTPRPLRRPRPPIVLGGSSPAAARRAARVADGFVPSTPDLVDVYRAELERLGQDTSRARPAPGGGMVVLVDPDPDRAWDLVGPYCMHDMREYAGWLRTGRGGSGPHHDVADLDDLRASRMYSVLTPEECVEHIRHTGVLVLHPLVGGLPPDVAWPSIEAITEKVLPALTEDASRAPIDPVVSSEGER